MKHIIFIAGTALSLGLAFSTAQAQHSAPSMPVAPMPGATLIIEAPAALMTQSRTIMVNDKPFTVSANQNQKMIETHLTAAELQKLRVAAEHSSCHIKWSGAPSNKNFNGYAIKQVYIKLDKDKSGKVICKEAKVTVAKA